MVDNTPGNPSRPSDETEKLTIQSSNVNTTTVAASPGSEPDNAPVHAVAVNHETDPMLISEKKETSSLTPAANTETTIVIHCNCAKWTIITMVVLVVVAIAVVIPLALRKGDVSGEKPQWPFVPPFEERLPLLSEKVLEGYQNVEEFESDLWKIAESYVNGVVGQQIGIPSYSSFGFLSRPAVMDDMNIKVFAATAVAPRTSAVAKGAVGDQVNDFETNNQVSGVEEGDHVVTDGEIAFAKYGEFIVSWNVTDGTKLLKMKLESSSSYKSKNANPFITINTLLFKQNHLVVAAGGFGYQAWEKKERILSGYNETRIFVFDVLKIRKNKIKLELLAERGVNGYYESMRSIGDNVHFVLSSEVNYYNLLAEPLSRFQKAFDGLDDEAYTNEVRRIASEKIIPDFIQQASEEILECGELPRMLRLNRWTTETNSHSASFIEHFLYKNGYAQTFMSVASFSLKNLRQNSTNNLECLSMTGTFFPVGPRETNVYAATDTMIMAVSGYNYSPSREMFIRSTYLVSYDLSQESSFPKAFGQVEGSVLSQYSFRVADSILQIATTVRQQWTWLRTDPQLQSEQRGGNVMSVPTTENWVMTMDMEGANGKMEELDRLKLGKEGEVFTAVRFYDGKAYAVTFLQMDPFYVLNTTNPHDLRISGELDNITGWSSYLEPMNDDKSVMLAIGQEADENGRTLGISISVFDAQDLQDVKVAARLLIESSTEVWSDSEGLRNKNAIRFNAETGRLILPLTIYGKTDGESFRGFRVFIVKDDSIVEDMECMVDLTDLNKPYAYSLQSFEPRSMIIKGSFMSMMENHIAMKDLDTCVTEWQLTIKQN